MKKKKDRQVTVKVFVGVLAGVLFVALGLALLAWLVASERVGEKNTIRLLYLMIGLASFLAAYIVTSGVQKNLLPFAGISSIILITIAFFIGLFMSGKYISIAPVPVSILVGGSVCCLLFTKKKSNRHNKKHGIVNITKK